MSGFYSYVFCSCMLYCVRRHNFFFLGPCYTPSHSHMHTCLHTCTPSHTYMHITHLPPHTHTQAQLLKKFTLLYDCNRQARRYTDALGAVILAITSLPTNQIASPDCASTLVSQWVWAKRNLKQPATKQGQRSVS